MSCFHLRNSAMQHFCVILNRDSDLFRNYLCVLFWDCFRQKHSGQNLSFHTALSPCQCRQGSIIPLPAYCVIHILVQSSRFFLMPFLPRFLQQRFVPSGALTAAGIFIPFHSSWRHIVWGAYPISPVMRLE